MLSRLLQALAAYRSLSCYT